MDVSYRHIFSTVAILLLSGCGGGGSGGGGGSQIIFDKPNPGCAANVISDRFVVKWKSGKITTHQWQDRESFSNQFVKTFAEQIQFVENDYRIQLPNLQSELQTKLSSSNVADNWGPERIGAEAAWKQNIRGEGIIVAVVDSGIDPYHSQLSNQLAVNIGETGLDASGADRRYNNIDDDGNGYIDDWAGFDFVDYDGEVSDTTFHGTHVSGIIAAEHDEDRIVQGPVQGIAPRAKILPLDFIDASGGGVIGDAIAAIDYAVQMGARVINASWGGRNCSTALAERVRRLESENVLFVAAAGNSSANIDERPEYPAAFGYPAQITVGSSSFHDGMAAHSNYGESSVHLFAPGDNIYSTVPDNQVLSFTGTSMATPFVAGTAALLWSFRPHSSVRAIKQAILTSVSSSPLYLNRTNGRLDVASSLLKLQ